MIIIVTEEIPICGISMSHSLVFQNKHLKKRRAGLKEDSCEQGPPHPTGSWLWKTAFPAFSSHRLDRILGVRKSAQLSTYTQPVAIPSKNLVLCWVAN